MARSDEQKQDLKLKITIGAVILVVGTLIGVLGPGLNKALDYPRQHKAEPWAPKWLYRGAKLMDWTMREDQAQELYVEFYHLYCGNEYDEPLFETVAEERNYDDEDKLFYCYWEVAKWDEDTNPRPERVSDTRHPLLPSVLFAIAKHYEDKKQYDFSDHLHACLYHMWPDDPAVRQKADDARRRAMLRTY